MMTPLGVATDAISPKKSRASEPQPLEAQHVDVYRVPGRFGGWPANHGMWIWGNEILVGFSAGYFKDNGPGFHAIDHDRPEEHLLARSTDGGLTWKIENPAANGDLIPYGKSLHGIAPPELPQTEPTDCPGGIDFTHPDFALTARMTDKDHGPSRFHYSTDRGHTWEGPFRLPDIEGRGVAARTDYLVDGPQQCTLMLTVAKANGLEGRVACVRTTDGGKTWKFVGWVGPEPEGYSIMPSTLRLGERELISAIRRMEGPRRWLDIYRSKDDGRTWALDSTAAPDTGEGNPSSLDRLRDGRICISYGYRAAPYEIRGRVSADGGHTWGPELVIRTGAGGRDIGYPISVARPDGRIVTAYYYQDEPLGDRYIAASIWTPPAAVEGKSASAGR